MVALLGLVWLLLAFVPLGFADDLLGPAVGARWTMSMSDEGEEDRIRVPAGSRMYVTTDVEDVAGMRCALRDAAGTWSDVGRTTLDTPEATDDERRIAEFATADGDIRIRCQSPDRFAFAFLWRDDTSRYALYRAVVFATRVAWVALLTAVVWGPWIVVRRRRRARTTASGSR